MIKGHTNGSYSRGSDTLENVKIKLSQQINALQSATFLSPKQAEQQGQKSLDLRSTGSNFMLSRDATTHHSNQRSLGVLSTSSISFAGMNSPMPQRSVQVDGRKAYINPKNYHFQQSNNNTHTRHVSILTGSEDTLSSSPLKQQLQQQQPQQQSFEENNFSPFKIKLKSAAQGINQISLGSRDISTPATNYNQNQSTQPPSSQGGRASSFLMNFKSPHNNNNSLKRQQSIEDSQESSPLMPFPSSSLRQSTISQPIHNLTASGYFQSIEHDYRPKTQSKTNNITKHMDVKQRPQTGANITKINSRRSNQGESIKKFKQLNISQPQVSDQQNENQSIIEVPSKRPMTTSSSTGHYSKTLKEGHKKRGMNIASSLFEDKKLLDTFQQQMQKAVDKLSSQSQAPTKNYLFAPTPPVISTFTNFPFTISVKPDPQQAQQPSQNNINLGQTNFTGMNNSNNNNLGNNLSSLPTSVMPSSTNLMEFGKNCVRIVQEIEMEMRNEQKEFVLHLIQPEQRQTLYTSAFQKIEKLLETKDLVILVQNLLFLANVAALVEDFDKASFFLLQSKIISDMSRKISHLKPQIFIQFGDLCIKTGRYTQALSFFKKALQYAWFYNQSETEVTIFEKLGITYFYMQDVVLSDFYHTRFISSLNEFPDSHHRNISQENITEYNLKLEYNLNQITPILMVHLQLPVQYSVDKIQHNLRESFLKSEMTKKKRGSNVDEKLSSLFREGQQEVENFMQSRLKVFQIANAAKIIEQLMQDREFTFQIDTPTFFAHPEKDENDNDIPSEVAACQRDYTHKKTNVLIHRSMQVFTTQDSRKKKKEWVAPIMKKTAYDMSKFGPMSDPRPSQRVFEDTTKYKLSLDKKIAVLTKQKIDYGKIMEKVNYIVSNNSKFHEQMHQRVRVSHISPNRFDPFRYNTPYCTVNQINRAYNAFLEKLQKFKDRKNKDMP